MEKQKIVKHLSSLSIADKRNVLDASTRRHLPKRIAKNLKAQPKKKSVPNKEVCSLKTEPEKYWKEKVNAAFAAAHRSHSKLKPGALNLEGFVGPKTRHFYNNLLNCDRAGRTVRYLETGTWTGCSFVSAVYSNQTHLESVVMDNWLKSDPSGTVVAEFKANCERLLTHGERYQIKDQDEDVRVSEITDVDVWLYNGDGSKESRTKAIHYFLPCMRDIFVMIVGDWDSKDDTVKNFKHGELRILYQCGQRQHDPGEENGIEVFVLRKTRFTKHWTDNLEKSLEVLFPNVRDAGPVHCIEIGCFEGRGTQVIHDHLMGHPDSSLTCVDPWADQYGSHEGPKLDPAFHAQFERFIYNTYPFRERVIIKRGVSNSVLPSFQQKPTFDFAYINGDHTPEQVYRDAVMTLPLMKKGGIILFNDRPWDHRWVKTRRGIDRFLSEFSDRVRTLFRCWQCACIVWTREEAKSTSEYKSHSKSKEQETLDKERCKAALAVFVKEPESKHTVTSLFAEAVCQNGYQRCAKLGVGYGIQATEVLRMCSELKHLLLVDAYTYYEDHWPSKCLVQKFPDMSPQQVFDCLFEVVQEWMCSCMPSSRYSFSRKSTREAAAEVVDGSLDAIFIADSHRYDLLLNALQEWWPKVRIGGCIWGDNYGYASVNRAVHDFAARQRVLLEFRARGIYRNWCFEKRTSIDFPKGPKGANRSLPLSLGLDKDFLPPYPCNYPPFKNDLSLEEYFRKWYLEQKEVPAGCVYIDALWSNLQVQPYFAAIRGKLQEKLDAAVRSECGLKSGQLWFTVTWMDSAVWLSLPKNTLIFGGSAGHIPLPLIYEDRNCTLASVPQRSWAEKSILCSFVGAGTHEVRVCLVTDLNGLPGFHIQQKEWVPDIKTSDQKNFIDITSKSKFALAPRGYGRSSFRFWEVMALGSVPIYVWDDIEWLPYKDVIDYTKLCISVHVTQIKQLPEMLARISETEYESMREYYRCVKDKFSLDFMCNYICNTLEMFVATKKLIPPFWGHKDTSAYK